EADRYRCDVLRRFRPERTSGHLAIGRDIVCLPTDDYEFRLGGVLPERPVRLFFDQDGPDRRAVVEVMDGSRLGEVMEESFGMEYFLSNEEASLLIAVNWYAIEFAGEAKGLHAQLCQASQ
ncbi:MAG: hypothetical protein AAFU79_32995, partial [Myxococcota bacterium]